MVIDHWIHPADIQAACGVTAILTMADMSGTMVTAKRVLNTGAQQAAFALLTSWIAYFGSPKCLRMDPGSGLIAPTMEWCTTLFGVNHMDIGATEEHEH